MMANVVSGAAAPSMTPLGAVSAPSPSGTQSEGAANQATCINPETIKKLGLYAVSALGAGTPSGVGYALSALVPGVVGWGDPGSRARGLPENLGTAASAGVTAGTLGMFGGMGQMAGAGVLAFASALLGQELPKHLPGLLAKFRGANQAAQATPSATSGDVESAVHGVSPPPTTSASPSVVAADVPGRP